MPTQENDTNDTGYDSIQRVEELQIGASLTVNCKRGTDVRDDDSVNITANFETIQALREGSDELTEIVLDRMAELRGFQPGSESDA